MKVISAAISRARTYLDRASKRVSFYLESSRLKKDETEILCRLSSACYRTSESALILISQQKTWDAEILSRTVLEGTMKFCHMIGNKSAAAKRIHEYEVKLGDIASISDHQKAWRVLELSNFSPEMSPLAELLLTPEERLRLTTLYPKSNRQKLQKEWGFTGIVEAMTRSDEALGGLAGGLLHSYAMSCHVAHADSIGIGMAWERDARNEIRRRCADEAHAARILSDQIWFSHLRELVLHTFIGNSLSRPASPNKDRVLQVLFRYINSKFYESEYPGTK